MNQEGHASDSQRIRKEVACVSKRPYEITILAGILLIGFYLRFYALGAIRHDYDDAYPIYQAILLLNGMESPLAGQPSSVFLDNPPLMKYLIAVPLLFQRSPWAVYVFITGLNFLGIYFTYRLSKQILGTKVGLLSAFLFAVSPWIVRFSRKTWLPALEPCLVPLIAWLLWPVLIGEKVRPSRMFAAIFFITVLTQTYVQSWGLLFSVGLLVLMFWPRIPKNTLSAGIALFLVASFIYGLSIAQNPVSNSAKVENFFSKGQLSFTREGIDHAVRLVTGWDFDYVYTRETPDYPARHRLSGLVHHLLGIALITGILRAIFSLKNKAETEHSLAIVLLVWFFTPVLLMSVAIAPVHPYYLLITCPAGQILAAWGASLLLEKRLWWVLLFFLALIGAVFALNLYRANEVVVRHPTTGPDFWGWQLEAGSRVGEIVRNLCSQTASVPCRISAKGHPALLTSLSGLPVRIVPDLDFPNYFLIPHKAPLLYILINTSLTEQPIPFLKALPQYELEFVDGTRVSFLYGLPCSREASLMLPENTVDWPSEIGLSLLGYTTDTFVQPGQPLHLVTYWRVDALYPERAVAYVGAFYHFVGPADDLIVNISGHGQWGYQWDIGDVYIERVEIPVPATLAPGTYQIRLGLFDFVNPRNYELLSPEGPTQAIGFPVIVK